MFMTWAVYIRHWVGTGFSGRILA